MSTYFRSIITGALVLCACGDSTGPRRVDPVRVGAAVSLTGSLSVEGAETERGYRLWAEWVNEEHDGILVDGVRRPVLLTLRDDGSDAARSAAIVRELVLQDSVQFLLGPYGSAATLTATAVAEELDVIMMVPNGASEDIYARGYRNTFGVLTPAREYTRAAMESLAARGARTVVLVHEQGGAFSTSVAEGAAHWAQQFGLQVLATLPYPRLATDVNALIDQAKALNPDAMVGGGHVNDAILFARTAARRSFRPNAILLTVGPGTPHFTATLRDTANLILGPTQWESTMSWQGEYLGTPAQYAARFAARFGVQPTYIAAQSTAAGIVLMHAIEAAGSADTDDVRAKLRATDLMTFYGPVRFDATGKNSAKPMAVLQIHNGQSVVVAPASIAVGSWVYPAR